MKARSTKGPRRSKERPSIIVLRALGLGDLLAAVPALRAIAAGFPNHRRVLAAPVGLRPIAEMTGTVDRVVDAAPLEPVRSRTPPEVGINLHGSGPQSHRAILAAKPGRLIAFAHPEVPASTGSPAWRPEEHEVLRWCRLLGESGIPADPSDLLLPRPDAPPLRIRGATVIHPGAASAARRWPVDRWTRVCRAEAEAGRTVVITGTKAERGSAAYVAHRAGLPSSAVLAGRTDLRGLARVVAWSGMVVSGDTGVAHLATAFGTPSVILFGPTPPAVWGPPPDRLQHVALWRGRNGDAHATTPDLGLLEIEVVDVLEAMARARPGGGPIGSCLLGSAR